MLRTEKIKTMIVFSRQVGVVQLAVVGGQLDTTMLNRDQQGSAESREEEQLRVLILDNRGELFLWQNSATQQLTRCAYLYKLTVHSEQMRVLKCFKQRQQRKMKCTFCVQYTFCVSLKIFELIKMGSEYTNIFKKIFFLTRFYMNIKATEKNEVSAMVSRASACTSLSIKT